MGRPLKIQKLNAGISIDAGFPQFSNLDQPTQVIPSGMTSSEFLGVVGGGYDGGIATATFPVVAISANINGVTGDSYIVTQKGQTKYLVAATDSVSDGSFVVGTSYIIMSLGTTGWTAIGAGVNPQVGDIFTALNVGGAGTGTASECGQAYLTNVATGSLTSGQMNMVFDAGAGNTYASRLTNKYIWDDAVPPTRYAVNFFTNTVTTAKSGADIATWTNGTGELTLAQVQSYTS